jgi:hypothetical protein
VKRRPESSEVRPLRERFKVVDRLACLDFDDRLQAMSALGGRQQDVRKHRDRSAPDWRRLLSPDIDADFVPASELCLQQANNPIVLELFTNGPHEYRAHCSSASSPRAC